ncbi:MAG: hypothetical protein K2M06_03540 [Muribaculaceae bacterium]|nr:hypothetical protein [Muribaculaceae bacterium]
MGKLFKLYPHNSPELKLTRKQMIIYRIIRFVMVVIFIIGSFFMMTHDMRVNDEKYSLYKSQSQWRMLGQMKSFSGPLYGARGNTPTQDLYLIEIDVDTIEFFRNDLPEDSPYYGVYNKNTKKAYITTTLYNSETNDTYKQSDPKPYLYADTRKSFALIGSNGLNNGIYINMKPALEEMAKDTANFIKF